MENAIVVLGDGDTFDYADNTFIYLVKEQASDSLNSGGFSDVSDDDIVDYVTLRDLLSCWNEKHGTTF